MASKKVVDAVRMWSSSQAEADLQSALAAASDKEDICFITAWIDERRIGMAIIKPMHLVYLRAVELGIEL